MKKLFACAIAISMLSGLYAMKLGLGVAYEDALEDGAYLAIKADARVPLMPIIDVRGCLLNIKLPDGGKAIEFGTFVDSDLMIKLPMPMPFQPYIALGIWLGKGLEDEPLDYTDLQLKAALGGEMSFGAMDGYLELGLNKLHMTFEEGEDAVTPFFVQAGVIFPLKFD
jgi:hypothetical protein